MLATKQEQFAQNVAVGMTGADAYRAAYAADRMSQASIYVGASRLRAHPMVALRIETLWEARWKAETYTRHQLFQDIMRACDQASAEGNHSAAIRGLAVAGKLIGGGWWRG